MHGHARACWGVLGACWGRAGGVLSLSLWKDAPGQLSPRLCMGVGKGPTPTSTVDQASARHHFPFGMRGTCHPRGGPPAPGALQEGPAQKPRLCRLGLSEGPGLRRPAGCLPSKVPSAGAGGALEQDARPPLRVSAVVFGHRWALEARPCPRPGGAPSTGPGACRSAGEDLPPAPQRSSKLPEGTFVTGFSLRLPRILATISWSGSGLVGARSGFCVSLVWARSGFCVGLVWTGSRFTVGSMGV